MSDEPSKKAEKKAEKKSDKKKENRKNIILEKWSEYRSEFRKIVWPSREALLKHTVTTIVISLIFGAIITLLDGLFGLSFTWSVGLLG